MLICMFSFQKLLQFCERIRYLFYVSIYSRNIHGEKALSESLYDYIPAICIFSHTQIMVVRNFFSSYFCEWKPCTQLDRLPSDMKAEWLSSYSSLRAFFVFLSECFILPAVLAFGCFISLYKWNTEYALLIYYYIEMNDIWEPQSKNITNQISPLKNGMKISACVSLHVIRLHFKIFFALGQII